MPVQVKILRRKMDGMERSYDVLLDEVKQMRVRVEGKDSHGSQAATADTDKTHEEKIQACSRQTAGWVDQNRVGHRSILLDPIQPNPQTNWPSPIRSNYPMMSVCVSTHTIQSNPSYIIIYPCSGENAVISFRRLSIILNSWMQVEFDPIQSNPWTMGMVFTRATLC